ncbi:MAG: phosphoenolpyruvate carboxykinase (ATP) [Anaerolineales bacterium]|nr:phosphoenolpyruvate carboxykinase (ATP) [Anaerolineales bacterium]MCB9129067.1 phosphoenolpyruvate carboxykinase (ATP) [Ardenticatenales bacterium]
MSDHTSIFPGLDPQGEVHWQLSPAELIEEAVSNGEGELTAEGPFNAITAPHTGRSPKDRFVVRGPKSEGNIWWGAVNVEVSPESYEELKRQILNYLNEQPNLYVRDVYAGADEAHRLSVRVVNEAAWSNLFIYNMFLRPSAAQLADFSPEFTILHAPHLKVEGWQALGFNTSTAVVVNPDAGVVLVAGTKYAGEMKKSIFGVMNYLLPLKDVLSMHCSANIGEDGDTALFFGLSGTGKTTLSADPTRGLIGDDEHGWDEDGIFNFEGGCYAKVIRLSEEAEPDIYATTRRFGTILENVVVDEETRELDLDDDSITENTRASYPLHFISNFVESGQGNHPKNIFFLTADAFGVLPPIARLTKDQAMYYFLSGYTAKVAGTERGVTEPQATFSACFGSPFLLLPPSRYAKLLGQKLEAHPDTKVWLINTGWSGGPYGVGKRMPIKYTRAMLHAALDGDLDDVETETDGYFGLHIPTEVPGVPSEVLHPRETWADKAAYDAQAHKLASMFNNNFQKYEGKVTDGVASAGPKL